MKKFVLANKGYTLLETLIGLIVLGVLMTLLLAMVQMMSKNNINNYFNRNVSVIVTKLENDFIAAKSTTLDNGKLKIDQYSGDKKVTYKCQGKKLVRRVNGLGGETLIDNLDSCSISSINDKSYKINITYKKLSKELYVGKNKM